MNQEENARAFETLAKRADAAFVLEVAETTCAEIRARGVEINALVFLDACRAADAKLCAKHGPVPALSDPDTLAKVLCDIARENGWTLTYKLEAL